jgi:hypothetical protein
MTDRVSKSFIFGAAQAKPCFAIAIPIGVDASTESSTWVGMMSVVLMDMLGRALIRHGPVARRVVVAHFLAAFPTGQVCYQNATMPVSDMRGLKSSMRSVPGRHRQQGAT